MQFTAPVHRAHCSLQSPKTLKLFFFFLLKIFRTETEERMDEKEGRGTCRNQQLMILHQWQFLVNLTTTVEISLLRLLRQKKYRRRKINVWRKILSLPSSTLTLLTGYSPHWKQLTPVSHHFSADSYTPTAFLHCWKYPNPPLSWSSAGNKQYWLITNSIQLTCTFTYYLLLAYYVPFFLNLRDLLNWNGSNQVRFGNSFIFLKDVSRNCPIIGDLSMGKCIGCYSDTHQS